MMITKCSCSTSIHNSLTALFLCVSIAISIYSLLYVQPWQHNYIDIVTVNTTSTTIMRSTTMDDGEEGNVGSIALVDDLMSPPIKGSVAQRIAWFKPRLKSSRLLKSTARTRKFNDKIIAFLSRGNDSNTRCKVQFFMTWISPRKLFGKRELLSLESVFNAHPKGCVVILSDSMDSELGRRILEPLVKRGYRVLPVAPDFHLLFKNTPAQGWIERLEAGLIDPGAIPITQNLSNLLRLVVLYTYGGVYIDTDVVILNDVSSLRNSVGIQTMENRTAKQQTMLNNAVLIFDKRHPILYQFIEEFATTFNGNRWGFNGPLLVTKVVFRQNRDKKKIKVNVLPPMAFYPVDWTQIGDYFRSISPNETKWAQEELNQVNSMSYGIHLWNKDTRSLKIEKGSIIGKLISDHCVICQGIYAS